MTGLTMVALQTATPTPGNLSAASNDLTNGLASMNSLTPLLAVIATILAAVLIVTYAASSLERFERIAWAMGRLKRMVHLAAYGVVGVVVLGALAAPAYYVASQPAGTRIQWATYAGWGLVGFLGLATFGLVVERVWERLEDRYAEWADETPQPATDGGDA